MNYTVVVIAVSRLQVSGKNDGRAQYERNSHDCDGDQSGNADR